MLPSEFCVFVEGVNDGDKGDFVFDSRSARAIIASRGKRTRVMIDYEHLSLDPDSDYYDPRAYGYGSLEYREGEGLYLVDVAWTNVGVEKLESREAAYISPAFYAPGDHVEELINVALTALPAMRCLSPLIAANNVTKDKDKSMPQELLDALGLSAEATLDEVLARVAELMAGVAAAAESEGAEAAADAVDAAAEATADAAETAADEMAETEASMTDEDKIAAMVGAEDEDEAIAMLKKYRAANATEDEEKANATEDDEKKTASLANRVARIEKAERNRVIATNAARMTPAQRKWAAGLSLANLHGFVSTLPPKALPNTVNRPTTPAATPRVDESALMVASATGMTAADIVAHRAQYRAKLAKKGKIQ